MDIPLAMFLIVGNLALLAALSWEAFGPRSRE